MSQIRRSTRALAFAFLASVSSLPLVSQAASACEQEKQSAWFEQQRQLTDGNVSPVRISPKRDCAHAATVASNDASAKERKGNEKQTSRE